MIGRVAALPRNAEVADQFDLLADLLELEGAESFRVLAYRRAATRMRETSGSIAQLALDGRAKELQGIGKTIEEKIVQIVEQGEIEALTKRKATIPPEVVLFMRLPGLGPKTAARIWQELGITTLDELKAAAEGERLRALAGPRREERGEDPQGARVQGGEPGRGAAPARRRACRRCRRSSPCCASIRRRCTSPRRARCGAARRRSATSTSSRRATDPAELTTYFTQLPWVVEVVAHGDTKATVALERGPALRPARRAARVVREPAAALHRLEGSQRRAARGRGAARALDLRVRRHDGRDRRGVQDARTRTRSTSSSATSRSRRSCARTRGELEAARRGELPELVELQRPARRPAHAHALVGRTARTRSRRWSPRRSRAATSTTRSPTTRTTSARAGSRSSSRRSRRCARSTRSCASSRASRRTSARTARSTCRRTSSPRSTGSSRRCTTRRENRPTERVLEAMDNPYVDCIGHLTGRRIRTRGPRDVDVERVIEKALEVGLLPRDQRPARPARPARRARARGEGGGAEARRQLRRAPDPRAELRRARRSGRRGAAG